jgi:hypothetical protein
MEMTDWLLLPFWLIVFCSFLSFCFDLMHIFDKMPRSTALNFMMFGPFAFMFSRVRDQVDPSRIARMRVTLSVFFVCLLVILFAYLLLGE